MNYQNNLKYILQKLDLHNLKSSRYRDADKTEIL